MTERFKDMVSVVINHEGGYVNDPDDRGGATKYGITQHTLDFYNEVEQDLDMAADVKNLTVPQAKRIYWTFYWNKYYDDIEDEKFAFKIFDLGINVGKNRAVKKLQLALVRHAESGNKITVDGIFGPKTLAALNDPPIETIYQIYISTMEHYYNAIVAKDRTQKKFLKGWLKRLEREYRA